MPDLRPVAVAYVEQVALLESGHYDDERPVLQQAKTLHMQLAPVFKAVYGGLPLFDSSMPRATWLSRASEWSSQALAAIDGGLYESTSQGWPESEASILEAILAAENRGALLRFADLVDLSDRTAAEVEASLRALMDGHLVKGIDATTFGGFDVLEIRLTASGRILLSDLSSQDGATTVLASPTESTDVTETPAEPPVELLHPAAEFDVDVAVSYSRVDEDIVRDVVDALKGEGVTVWWDQDNEAEAWGSNLEQLFADVFANRARYVMVFLSEAYTESDWTRYELEVASEASRIRESAYVLPVMVDEHVPAVVGLSRMIGFVSLRDHTPQEIAALLREKVFTDD